MRNGLDRSAVHCESASLAGHYMHEMACVAYNKLQCICDINCRRTTCGVLGTVESQDGGHHIVKRTCSNHLATKRQLQTVHTLMND